MKTTLNIRDDIIRQSKARAALAGKPLSRFVEESLIRALEEAAPDNQPWYDWCLELPDVAPEAVAELRETLSDSDFREIDVGMWQ